MGGGADSAQGPGPGTRGPGLGARGSGPKAVCQGSGARGLRPWAWGSGPGGRDPFIQGGVLGDAVRRCQSLLPLHDSRGSAAKPLAVLLDCEAVGRPTGPIPAHAEAAAAAETEAEAEAEDADMNAEVVAVGKELRAPKDVWCGKKGSCMRMSKHLRAAGDIIARLVRAWVSAGRAKKPKKKKANVSADAGSIVLAEPGSATGSSGGLPTSVPGPPPFVHIT